MKWFLAGLGLGVAVGVLIAPAPVVERRRRLFRSAGQRLDHLRQEDPGAIHPVRGRAADHDEIAPERPAQAMGPVTVTIPAGAVDPLLDFLNTATEEQLIAVKGIGKKTAQQVLTGRPYERIEALEGRASRAQIEAIRLQLTNEPTI